MTAGAERRPTYDAIVVGSGISWRVGRQGADRGGAAHPGARARPQRRARQGLPDREPPPVGAAARQPTDAAGSRRLPRPEGSLSLRPGLEALLRQGRRPPVQPGPRLPLVPRLSGGRAVAAVGAPLLSLERPRLRGKRARGRRHRLADPLQGHRALVRPRRIVHRRQRRERGPAPSPRRQADAAVRDELHREAPARPACRRASPTGASSAAARRC